MSRFDRLAARLAGCGGSGASQATPPRAETRRAHVRPKVEAIVFDFASKIRTVLRANGTVEEEPFETAVAEKLKRAKRPGGPEIKFVNEDATNQD